MDNLISVIVPVYKAEKTISRCVKSICNQTYLQLEIILVDDGSSDKCAEICDRFAKKDSRITVIHQLNGGVSAARNAGLAVAHGDYIGFVDSDDFIDSGMYERLLQGVLERNAQVCVCGVKSTYNNKVIDVKKTDKPVVLSGDEAICELIKNRTHSLVLWNKLWKKDLFECVAFPEGRVFEDAATTWKLIIKADRVLFLPDCLYHYNQIEGSLVHTYSLKHFEDEWIETKARFEVLSIRYPQIEDKCLGECAMVIARVWGWYSKAETQDKEIYRGMLLEMSEFVHKYSNRISKSNIPIHIKAGCIFAKSVKTWSFTMAGGVHSVFRTIIGSKRKLIKLGVLKNVSKSS